LAVQIDSELIGSVGRQTGVLCAICHRQHQGTEYLHDQKSFHLD
jgi:hypothetical protein